MDDTFYVPGGPVIVNTLGEEYLSSFRLQPGLLRDLARATGGLAVVWGQRYYYGGNVVPSGVYTTENLRFHSIEQALSDLAYFAQHVTFPGLQDQNLTAPNAPWIIIGGSYGGQTSTFARIQYPHLFWGALSSSGVTTAVNDFWQFYDTVRRYGPANCISVQQRLIDIANSILTSDNQSSIDEFKSGFGAQDVTSNNGLASVFSLELSADWSSDREWVPGRQSPIDSRSSYCSDITSTHLPDSVSARQKATARSVIANGGWANETELLLPNILHWFGRITRYFQLLCPSPKRLDECLSEQVPSPYDWIQCTEWGGFYTGYVAGSPDRPDALPIATTLENPTWYIDRCRKTYNFSHSYDGPDLHRVNKYGGITVSHSRLILSTGAEDIWRGLTPLAEQLQASIQPNPRVQCNGTADSPHIIMAKGGHEWDLDDIRAAQYTHKVPPLVVKAAHALEIEAVKRWLAKWKEAHAS
ncbi:hypothetical protein LTR37_019459 [Vermiconidia calcicola]|uniref:Uncharacterized protein n=1 Tax=Vermiconidia calcicola TaxID=1690605 RepID=A0ACC3MFY9_9PEZI|nr:hypothetical protein LTR37_019459 [Vermiconidia calcicola]